MTSTATVAAPTFPGVYLAKVYSVSDPLGVGRIQMYIPQIYGQMPVNIWAPPLSAGASTPAVGDLVWCMFHGGDSSFPTFLPAISPNPFWQINWSGANQTVTPGAAVPLDATSSAVIEKGAGSWASNAFTCAQAGLYKVRFQAGWAFYTAFTTPNYSALVWIYVNGVAKVTGGIYYVYVSEGVYAASSVAKAFQLNVGDTVEFYVQISGTTTSQQVTMSPEYTWAEIEWSQP
jgi:Type VI secretion system/phage-baseplate injector OB domain